jgi:hypothetical protein
MAQKGIERQVTQSKTIKFSDKFGLDKDRKKLGSVTDEKKKPVPVYSPGKNFKIFKIVISDSKKKYDHVSPETDEIVRGRIPIAQFDIVTEDGERQKFYSPNSAIVEACENILKDADFGADKDGNLSTPAEISEVIEGTGDKNRPYIAFA